MAEDRIPPPSVPVSELRSALGDSPHGNEAVDALHAEWTSERPDPAVLHQHVGALRRIPVVEAIVANWWEDPGTQRIVDALTKMGL